MNRGENGVPQTRVSTLLRWGAMVPIASLAAFLALFLSRLAVWLGFSTMLDPRSWIYKLLIKGVGSVCLGAAYLYTGVEVAPERKRLAIYILGGFAIAFFAVDGFLALRGQDFLALYSAAVALGSTLVSASVKFRELGSGEAGGHATE